MSFIVPTLKENIEKVEAAYSALLKKDEMPVSEQLVEARILGNAINGIYGYIKYLSSQIIATTAEKEYLERHAARFGIFRKKITTAKGQLIGSGNVGSNLPKGTKLTRDKDGLEYEITESVLITERENTVNAECLIAGNIGNCVAAETFTLSVAIGGINKSLRVLSIGGGADVESDKDLLIRYLEYLREPPHGGSDADWVKWAKEVPGINRAWVYPHELGVGTVVLRVMTPDGVADEQLLEHVRTYIDIQRPVTVKRFEVYNYILKVINFQIHLVPDTAEVRSTVHAELDDLFKRYADKGIKQIPLSQINEAISIADGEDDHTLLNPTQDLICEDSEILVLGDITWI